MRFTCPVWGILGSSMAPSSGCAGWASQRRSCRCSWDSPATRSTKRKKTGRKAGSEKRKRESEVCKILIDLIMLIGLLDDLNGIWRWVQRGPNWFEPPLLRFEKKQKTMGGKEKTSERQEYLGTNRLDAELRKRFEEDGERVGDKEWMEFSTLDFFIHVVRCQFSLKLNNYVFPQSLLVPNRIIMSSCTTESPKTKQKILSFFLLVKGCSLLQCFGLWSGLLHGRRTAGAAASQWYGPQPWCEPSSKAVWILKLQRCVFC